LVVTVKKGPLAEALVVRCLQEHGWPYAERRVMGGSRDRGDVAGIPGLVIEVKNRGALALAEWVDEAVSEATPLRPVALIGPDGKDTGRTRWDQVNDLGVVWHKRRGKGDPLDWYVTMTGRDFLALLAAYTRED